MNVVKPVSELYEHRAKMSFRDTFVRLRKEHGWTQQEIADRIGISVGQVKKYEKGVNTPTLHILGRIAEVYGVSTDQLVFPAGHNPAVPKLDQALLRRFELLADLPDRERDAVLVLLDSVIARQRLKEVVQEA